MSDEQLAMPGFIAKAIEAQGRTRPEIVLTRARELTRRDWPTRLAAGEPSIEDCLADGELFRKHIAPFGELRS
jgi:hypothetical protein